MLVIWRTLLTAALFEIFFLMSNWQNSDIKCERSRTMNYKRLWTLLGASHMTIKQFSPPSQNITDLCQGLKVSSDRNCI